jgi:outer membrane protein assembly factor BamB
MTRNLLLHVPARRPTAAPALVASALSLMLAGCGIGSWFGDTDKPPLPGERISVLRMESRVAPDAGLAQTPMALPAATVNDSWPQAGGYPDHAMGHLAIGGALHEAWRGDGGAGSGSTQRILSRPVVAGGRVFTMDADSHVAALDQSGGRSMWRVGLKPENERGDSVGGGIAFGEDLLFAATGYAELVALSPGDGSVVWRKKLPGPARGAPTIVKGRVFAQTLDNQTLAFSARDGESLWSHTGILETAGLLGSVSPAADASVLIAPYSSGEIYALRQENGRPAWSDNLASIRRVGALSGLADIRGMPVIDRGLVFAVSHSGRTVAIDQRTGGRVWEQELGGVDTPWPAGDYVFVLTNESEVVALQRRTGRVRWVSALQRYEDPKDRTAVVVWAGPVLAGERLWLAGSTGELVGLSAASGEVVQRLKLPAAAVLAPVVAGQTLFVLTENGTVTAFR